MPLFSCKKIPSLKRVCLRLKDAREAKGLTLEALQEKTKIDRHYLLALESCRFDLLPEEPIYHKQFIRRYLKAVGLESEDYIRQYLLEEGNQKSRARRTPTRPLFLAHLPNIPRLSAVIGGGLVILLVALYLGWHVNNVLRPPWLSLASPEDGVTVHESSITVRGMTDPETRLDVNGQKVSLRADGVFEQEVLLSSGINTIVVTATKKHGKQSREVRYVIHRSADDLAQKDPRRG